MTVKKLFYSFCLEMVIINSNGFFIIDCAFLHHQILPISPIANQFAIPLSIFGLYLYWSLSIFQGILLLY